MKHFSKLIYFIDFLRLSPTASARWPLAGLFFLFMALPRLTQAQCPSFYTTLSTQDQVDAFPPGCTNFSGYLTVSGADITNLNGLRNLTSVSYDFSINTNNKLTDLMGLSNLVSVNGNLQLTDNPALTSIAALTALTSVGNSLIISNDAQLTNLTGLGNLQSVGTNLQIVNNSALSVCALPAICQLIATKSANQLSISGNAPGCSSLQEVQNNCTPWPSPASRLQPRAFVQVPLLPLRCLPRALCVPTNGIRTVGP